MELRTVENPVRGCGQLKQGGFYARGDSTPGGTLNAWSWVLGQHVIGGWNYNISATARQMQLVHLPATLATGLLATEPVPLDEFTHMRNLPRVAVLDHVGSQHYTPYAFFEECVQHGPSRRIPPDIAKAIAKNCPIPILFTHSWLPTCDQNIVADVLLWSESDVDAVTFDVTTFDPDWGITTKAEFRGETHWLIPVLREMNRRSGGQECHLTKIMPPSLVENTLLVEQLFGISWITRCVYIADANDSESKLADIFKLGIEPVRIADGQQPLE